MAIAKVTYADLIEALQNHMGFSYFRSRTILKELSRLLTDKLSKGLAVECEGLFRIDYTITGKVNSNETYYGIEEQARDLSDIVGISYLDTLNAIRLYYGTIKTKIESGYASSVKAIAYITPKEDENGAIYIDGRISPQIMKPEMAEFLVIDKEGDMMLQTVDKNQLRLSIMLDSTLRIPYRIVDDGDSLKPTYIQLRK